MDIPIIGAAVIRVAAVVSSVKRNAYSDIPNYAATAPKAITTPMISVIASVRYKRLAVSRLDNARLGERGRRQRKCDKGTEN